MIYRLNRVRLSFPQLWRPVVVRNPREPDNTGKPTYAANALILPADPQVVELNRIIDQVAHEKWKEKTPLYLAELRAKDRICLHNGDYKADYDGYQGMYFLSARNSAKPLVVNKDPFVRDETGQPLIDPKNGKPLANLCTEDMGIPYGGCYVNMSVDIYAQDNEWGRRINATLRGVQYLEDGDAFGAGPPATAEEFDNLAISGEGDLV